MTRILRIIVHNWPLKLAAIGLATLLYGGLVLSQSAETFDAAVIPVDPRGLSPDTILLTNIDPVTEVRYFSPAGRRAIADSFEAWIDLADVPVGSGPVEVPVHVDSPEFRVISFTPDRVTVELDRIESRRVPVQVRYDVPPEGLATGEPTYDPANVTIIGPRSKIDAVVFARADAVIQPSGISVDGELPLTPVDAEGNTVTLVSVEPRTSHVTIPVFANLRSKTVPVTPIITGTPAPGFEIASVSVEPTVVTIAGNAEQLGAIVSVDTAPVSTNGVTDDVEIDVELALPTDIQPVDVERVHVVVTLRAVTATRSFEAGLRLQGARADLDYSIGVDRVILTLGGSTADLDRLSGSEIVANLQVGGLGVGTTEVPVVIDLPAGVTLVAASPPRVAVTVSSPPAPPSVSPASTFPSPTPGA